MAQKHADLVGHGMQPYKSNAETGGFWNFLHFNTESDFVFVELLRIQEYKMHIIKFKAD